MGTFCVFVMVPVALRWFALVIALTSLLIAHPRFPWLDRNLLIDTLIENSLSGLQVRQTALAN